MDQSNEGSMKKISNVNLDKLIDDFSQIEKKMIEITGKNNLLDIQLEKNNSLLKIMQTKEATIKEELSKFQCSSTDSNMFLGYLCIDENEQLKRNVEFMKEKLKSHEQEYKNSIAKLISEMKIKEEGHKIEMSKLFQDMQKKVELKEEKHQELMAKKEMEISELNTKFRTQEKEKQNEILRLRLEFDTKLARVQTKSKSYPDATILPQSIYRRKLQYLQEEKSKEIASLQNTIRDLEQRLAAVKDSRLTRRRF
ncbi:coiled-coil domain-containing protein [Cricetulus griseus]|uniref:Coiled-coil domain-containing protein n=1 Tax=Cricetulus griseus TaxID=10029 RepID=A0A061IHC7_CRIGR|nr:coiled-coil domain-containing protein [Cricetulus griseus]